MNLKNPPPPSLLSVQTALKFALRNNHDKHLGGLPIKNEHFVIYRHGETFFSPISIRQSLVLSFGFTIFLCLLLPFSPSPIFSLFPSSSFFPFLFLPSFFFTFPEGSADLPTRPQICRWKRRFADGILFMVLFSLFPSSPFSLNFSSFFLKGAQICRGTSGYSGGVAPPPLILRPCG